MDARAPVLLRLLVNGAAVAVKDNASDAKAVVAELSNPLGPLLSNFKKAIYINGYIVTMTYSVWIVGIKEFGNIVGKVKGVLCSVESHHH